MGIPGNIVLPTIVLTMYLGTAFLAGLAACILLVTFSNFFASKYKQKVKEKFQVTWWAAIPIANVNLLRNPRNPEKALRNKGFFHSRPYLGKPIG